jgi:hypothetical protein
LSIPQSRERGISALLRFITPFSLGRC